MFRSCKSEDGTTLVKDLEVSGEVSNFLFRASESKEFCFERMSGLGKTQIDFRVATKIIEVTRITDTAVPNKSFDEFTTRCIG